MSKIEELIKRYENLSTGNDEADVFIKVKLKMIRGLFEDIKGSEECIYMEEIISKFAEIMDCQWKCNKPRDWKTLFALEPNDPRTRRRIPDLRPVSEGRRQGSQRREIADGCLLEVH